MYSISGRVDAGHKTERRVRVVTAIALLASVSYVTWGVIGLPTSPWLAYPFFALEALGLCNSLFWQHRRGGSLNRSQCRTMGVPQSTSSSPARFTRPKSSSKR